MTDSMDYEDHAFEIAKRVLKSYSDKEPEEEQVTDLGCRIHKAAADITNEELEAVLNKPSSPDPYDGPSPVWGG